MAKLDWIRELDDKDLKTLLDKDMKLVYEYCELDTLIDLLENVPGISLYTSRRSVERAQKFYIIQNFDGNNHKELAAKLNCSQQFVYETMKEYHESDKGSETATADLFKKVDS